MKKTILFVLTVLLSFTTAIAQNVAINSSGNSPDASAGLDVNFTDKGLLIPRVDIADLSSSSPISSPAVSLVVYNTNTTTGPGYFYWDGGKWVELFDSNNGRFWKLSGNSGTTEGTDFLGTTDNKRLDFRTNNAIRATISSGGNVGIGTTSPGGKLEINMGNNDNYVRVDQDNNVGVELRSGTTGGTPFIDFSNDASTDYDARIILTGSDSLAIEGTYVGIGTATPQYTLHVVGDQGSGYGTGLIESVNTSTNNDAAAVYGRHDASDWWGYGGYFKGGYKGVEGAVYPSGSYIYYGVDGEASGGSGTNYGVYAYSSTSGNAYGVYGYANSSGSNLARGVFGSATASSGTPVGVQGYVSDADGYAVYGINGDDSGTGLIALGNNEGTFYYPTNGGGLAATGNEAGVYGYGTTSGDGAWGGYFEAVNNSNQYAYVAGQYNGTAYKINGQGSVSTIVKRTDGTRANMFCPEAPEILFQDYGEGKLVNGKAHIDLDPIFSKNIVVNDKHPLRVFVQLRGDCNGVYVTNETQNGFDVVELQNGNSNVKFYWTVTANRSDEYDEKGNRISKNADVRFPDGPGPVATRAVKTPEMDKVNQDPKRKK